ncbi:hypothetical protein ABIA38_003307 [Embleya sp. AB8]
MSAHHAFTVATDIPVCFRAPAGPRRRGSNENVNGLLRQYFPKGTDLSVHSREHFDAVAAQLNGRPRKTLDWEPQPSACINCPSPRTTDHVLRWPLESKFQDHSVAAPVAGLRGQPNQPVQLYESPLSRQTLSSCTPSPW